MSDGHAARVQIDRALAARPVRDGEALTAAVRALAVFRDSCIERHRRDGEPHWRGVLEHVNAIISVVMAAEFPIGEMPWAELAKARGWLDTLLQDEPAQ